MIITLHTRHHPVNSAAVQGSLWDPLRRLPGHREGLQRRDRPQGPEGEPGHRHQQHVGSRHDLHLHHGLLHPQVGLAVTETVVILPPVQLEDGRLAAAPPLRPARCLGLLGAQLALLVGEAVASLTSMSPGWSRGAGRTRPGTVSASSGARTTTSSPSSQRSWTRREPRRRWAGAWRPPWPAGSSSCPSSGSVP